MEHCFPFICPKSLQTLMNIQIKSSSESQQHRNSNLIEKQYTQIPGDQDGLRENNNSSKMSSTENNTPNIPSCLFGKTWKWKKPSVRIEELTTDLRNSCFGKSYYHPKDFLWWYIYDGVLWSLTIFWIKSSSFSHLRIQHTDAEAIIYLEYPRRTIKQT